MLSKGVIPEFVYNSSKYQLKTWENVKRAVIPAVGFAFRVCSFEAILVIRFLVKEEENMLGDGCHLSAYFKNSLLFLA